MKKTTNITIPVLPKNAQDWTPEQIEEQIQWFIANKSVSEMRRYQRINTDQIRLAYNMKNTDTLVHLQTLDRIYIEVIGRQTFPDWNKN